MRMSAVPMTRWSAPGGADLRDEVVRRLLRGKALDDLHLGEHEGRVDLRGLQMPSPELLGTQQWKGWGVQELGGLVQLREVTLSDLDLSWGQLDHLRFFTSRIANCRFGSARCLDWRMWATETVDCSFVGADLRNSVLGSWYENRENVWRRVDFSQADLRSIVSKAALFEDCVFSNARLAKTNFESSGFVRCTFAGELRDVIFNDRGYRSPKQEPNAMVDVDFSEAELRDVEFRHLDLDRMIFPRSSSHLVVRNYRCVLTKALEDLAGNESMRARSLRAVLENRVRWAGGHQEAGVFNVRDFREREGDEDAAWQIEVIRRAERECGASSRN
jgi:uncharacterized protein YjbI with pentapeptide repeats